MCTLHKVGLQINIAGFLAMLLVGIAKPASAAGTPSASTLMQATMKADQTAAYSATETLARQSGPTMTTKVWRDGTKKRYEYLAPAVMKGDLLVDNGSTVWRYHRAEKTAVKTKTAARRVFSDADRKKWTERFTSAVVGREAFAGRNAYVVTITPRGGKKPTRKYWIDTATNVRLRSERYTTDGKRVEVSSLSNIKFTRPAASSFEWKPPAGVAQSSAGTLFLKLAPAQRAATWLKPPTRLPAGFGLESIIVDPMGEAWFRYTNGTSRFSIFQQRSKSDTVRELQQVDGSWYWQRGGNRFLIVGLGAAEAKRVAGSVN